MPKTLAQWKQELDALLGVLQQATAPPPAEAPVAPMAVPAAAPAEVGPPCLHPLIRDAIVKQGLGYPDCAGSPTAEPCWHPDIRSLVNSVVGDLPVCEVA